MEADTMTITPIHLFEITQNHRGVSKLRELKILEREEGDHQTIVHISTVAKKRQVLEQARSEVLEKIRSTK
jgi:hypothetical protein